MQPTKPRVRRRHPKVCIGCGADFDALPASVYCSRGCGSRHATPRRDPLDRFHEKYIVTSESCWEWTGARNRDGYGWFLLDGRAIGAHVASWRLIRGDTPEGMELDHICRNRACVNPDHLDPVPHIENVRRGNTADVMNGTRDRCKRGHLFSEHMYISPKGFRTCRECKRLAERRRYHALKN